MDSGSCICDTLLPPPILPLSHYYFILQSHLPSKHTWLIPSHMAGYSISDTFTAMCSVPVCLCLSISLEPCPCIYLLLLFSFLKSIYLVRGGETPSHHLSTEDVPARYLQ